MTIQLPETSKFVEPAWTIGDRLQKARESAGITLKDLTRRLGISYNMAGYYQQDNVQSHNIEVILRWCYHTRVRPSYIDPRWGLYDAIVESELNSDGATLSLPVSPSDLRGPRSGWNSACPRQRVLDSVPLIPSVGQSN